MLDGDADFVLLDVRSCEEYDAHRFKDKRLVNIPVNELKTRHNELSKGKEIVIYCATSVRAYNAERELRGYGFDQVRYLDGSIRAWPYLEYLT
jgi:rhodanese-related sulfurtransferase